MKKLILLSAITLAGIATANADGQLKQLWLNEGVAGQSGTTRQGVGHNGKMYLLNSQYGATGQGWIEVWDETGLVEKIQPEDAALCGTNITIDDAGNIIARQGVFPNAFVGSPAVFVYNAESGTKKSFNLDESVLLGGRNDFWGHVSGDVLSEDGGLLLFGTNGNSGMFNEIKIVNGEHVVGGQQGGKDKYYGWEGVVFGTTSIFSTYSWLPNEAAMVEGPGAGETPKPIYHLNYDKSGDVWVWRQDGQYITPERNITSGFALFQMGEQTYIVYSRGGNNADAFAIAKAQVQKNGEADMENPSSLIVAKTFGIMNEDGSNTKYNGTPNTAVHFNVEVAEDGQSALIYQYSPRNFVAVYEFTPEQPAVDPEDPEDPNVDPEDPEDPNVDPEDPEDPNVDPEDPEDPNVDPEDPEDPNVDPEEPTEISNFVVAEGYEMRTLWLNDDVAGLSGSTRQGVGHNGKMYLLNSRFGVDSQGWIEVWDKDGLVEKIQPEGEALSGTNITIDDAGNIIARQGVFPDPVKGDTRVFVYNADTNVSKTFSLDGSKIMDGRIDFWGHVAGDVTSEEGGYLMFGNSGAALFNEVKIAECEHVLGGRQNKKNNYNWNVEVGFGTTGIINNYAWLPNEAAMIAGPGAGDVVKPIYHMSYDTTGETWVWNIDGQYITPERNITSGFELFKIGEETFIVYSRGGNNADAFAIAKAQVQLDGEDAMEDPSSLIVVRKYAFMNDAETAEKYSGTANTAVHFNVEVDEETQTATIYQYSPRNFVAVYEFKVAQVEEEDPGTSGIESIAAGNNSAPVYYNLQGVRVANPQAGRIYIEVSNGAAKKVVK